MFYETTQTLGPGWQKSYKPKRCENMTWSPSLKHFRSPGSSPQSYRRIIHQDDEGNGNDRAAFFNENTSPTFPRKIFRDVWTDTPASSHRFSDKPRLFKRVFTPNRWEDDDDFERTRSSVRQMARDFGSDFERDVDRNFDSGFRHRDRPHKSDMEEELDRAAGKVHHIPIMVEKRLEEMRSRFEKGRQEDPSEYDDETEEWHGPGVHRLMRNFERAEDSPHLYNRQRVLRDDDIKPWSFTSPVNSKWDPGSVHTLPTRRSSKGYKIFDDTPVSAPKPVFRSYSETHEDIPKHHQQQHTAAFRSHSDGHCPKTVHVTKISVNIPSKHENTSTQCDETMNDSRNKSDNKESYHEDKKYNQNSQTRTFYNDPTSPKDYQNDRNQKKDLKIGDDVNTSDEKVGKRTSLQQIAAVLQNVADLFIHVDSYSGIGRDKQYRFLDEMLTRCMLRLDDVDTEGREDIRSARKAAVMQVQSCIEKLEYMAQESENRQMQDQAQKTEWDENSSAKQNENNSLNVANDHGNETKGNSEQTLDIDSKEDSEHTTTKL